MMEPGANRLEDNPKTSWLQVAAVGFPHWARQEHLTHNQLNAGSCFPKAVEFADTLFWLPRGVGGAFSMSCDIYNSRWNFHVPSLRLAQG